MKKVSFVQEHGFQSSGSNLWNIAIRHQASKVHIANHVSYNVLGNTDVASALDEERQRQITQHNNNATLYARMLENHINVIVFLAGQGLAFRGHDESSLSSNRGNFIELLELIGKYSQDLREFLTKQHVTYTSHEPQNDLIKCVYQEVRAEIQRRIDNSKFLAVMMDDTSDTSNIEQSAVSIRLIYDGKVEEHLLAMANSSGDQSADGLRAILMETLKSYNITPENCAEKLVGQSYDGAPSMSGELSGVQKQIQDMFPFAYYNHCVAHRLSLCASQTSKKIPRICKFFHNVDKMVTFIRSSPKRTHILGRNMPKPGDTRWLSRDTALTAIDSSYEELGSLFYAMSKDPKEKAETKATARGLCVQLQNVEFVFLLTFYRKLFDLCTPISLMMQKPTLDAVQVTSMLEDFDRALKRFDYQQIWEDTLDKDPEIPVVRVRDGWRGVEEPINGAPASWRETLTDLAKTCTATFSNQLAWRFHNLEKFKWMDLIHPAKFEERKKASLQEQRALLKELCSVYSFAFPDEIALEHCLSVLYHNMEVAALLRKVVKERDAAIAKKKEKRLQLAAKKNSEDTEVATTSSGEEERALVEVSDEFSAQTGLDIEDELVKKGKPTLQDLLDVFRRTGLQEALPQAVTLMELATVTPLTSVHCERVFSRLKRVVSPTRSTMLQERKEMLVFLQVEHKILRWLAQQPDFHTNVIARFSYFNKRRMERFSRK